MRGQTTETVSRESGWAPCLAHHLSVRETSSGCTPQSPPLCPVHTLTTAMPCTTRCALCKPPVVASESSTPPAPRTQHTRTVRCAHKTQLVTCAGGNRASVGFLMVQKTNFAGNTLQPLQAHARGGRCLLLSTRNDHKTLLVPRRLVRCRPNQHARTLFLDPKPGVFDGHNVMPSTAAVATAT